MNADDEQFQNYLISLKKVHDKFLLFIFKGQKFSKLEQHPMHSTDLNYGIPQIFNQILDELLEEADDEYEAYTTPQEVQARMTITATLGRKTEQYRKLGEALEEDGMTSPRSARGVRKELRETEREYEEDEDEDKISAKSF